MIYIPGDELIIGSRKTQVSCPAARASDSTRRGRLHQGKRTTKAGAHSRHLVSKT